MCVDLNGRTDKLPDATDIDNLPNINSLEYIVSGVLNGLFDPKQDNYTCISHKGKSVVYH